MRRELRIAAQASSAALVVGGFLLFSTCQGNKKPSQPGGSGDATALSGTWSTACLPDAGQAGFYNTDSRTFNGKSFTTSFVSYSDAACKTVVVSQKQTGTFALGEAVPNSDAFEIDITLSEVDVTLQTADMVKAYNDKNICNGGWEIGKTRQLSRAACGAQPSADGGPDMVFDIFAVRGDVLFFGKKSSTQSGRSESQRPTTLDESRPFKRS